MTGYTVHTGSNRKFASGWEQVFGAKPATAKKKAAAQTPSGKAAGKKRKK